MPLDPADLNAQIASSFVQDEIAIPPDRRYLTVGAKLEHDDYTGFVLLPSARATQSRMRAQCLGRPYPERLAHHTAWTPEALNFGGFPRPGGIPVLIGQVGNRRRTGSDSGRRRGPLEENHSSRG
jgi:hypothetical protein